MTQQNLKSVIISDGDTLSAIVARELGTLDRLAEVASLNGLRPPYISADPYDIYGPGIEAFIATGTISAGATTLTNPYNDARVNMTLLFRDRSPAGFDIWDVTTILSNASGTLTFSEVLANVSGSQVVGGTGLQNTYRAGAKVYLCPDTLLRGKVLTTGGVLLVPTGATSGSTVVGDDYARWYGIDIQCGNTSYRIGDPGSDLQLDNYGDYLTIAGVGNLSQALANRVRTPLGFDTAVPNYGCSMYLAVGKAAAPEVVGLYASKMRRELLRDGRVQRIENIVAAITATGGVNFTVSARARNADSSRLTDPIVIEGEF